MDSIREYVKENCYPYVDAKELGQWKGYTVYELVSEEKEEGITAIGLPNFLLVKDGNIELNDTEDSLKILNYFYPDDDEDEEDEE